MYLQVYQVIFLEVVILYSGLYLNTLSYLPQITHVAFISIMLGDWMSCYALLMLYMKHFNGGVGPCTDRTPKLLVSPERFV